MHKHESKAGKKEEDVKTIMGQRSYQQRCWEGLIFAKVLRQLAQVLAEVIQDTGIIKCLSTNIGGCYLATSCSLESSF